MTDNMKQGKNANMIPKMQTWMKSKKKPNTNKIHDALVERDHGPPHGITTGSLHWLEIKDRVVLNHFGIHFHDHVLMENVFLDDRNEITKKSFIFSACV